MIEFSLPPNISFSLEKARRVQTALSKMVIREDRINAPIKYVAGVDVAYAEEYAIGAVAVLSYETLEPVEVKTALVKVRFPYVPTLLSFREMPAAVAAIKKLEIKPNVFLVDGQGIAHPYRLGFASHLGVTLNVPTIGVAKRLLCGEVLGDSSVWRPVVHEGEVVGGAVYTKHGTKPIYVSIGHMVSLETAIKIVLACTRGYRIPEPLRLSHISAERIKKEFVPHINSP
ncbi:MAG: deoxyribonuclease V [Candidatus Bathyarchaeia archaeon]|nr:deoxyribonuclease V [Candidatus Bathyarchaeota archaeon]